MTDGLNNQFILGGINFDDHSSLKDNNSVFYLRNADISDFSNSNQTPYAQNALSNELCVELPQRLVGTIKVDKNNVILFLKDDHNCYIKMLDTVLCTVIDIAAGECLNFQDDKQVTGVYKYQNGHIVIYFTDNYNPPRYLDLSNVPRVDFNECSTCQKAPSEVLDCKELKIWKSGEVPEIKVDVTSGNIPAGVYQIAIAFSEKDDTLTDWFIYEKKFNLHGLYGEDKRFGFILEIGCIKSKLDFQIALISNREDRGTSAQIIGRYTPAQTNISITEIDSVQYSPISLDELFLTNAYYEKAAHVTNNGDHLIFADLTSIDEFDYQPLANQI
jgi:hypothetical protein